MLEIFLNMFEKYSIQTIEFVEHFLKCSTIGCNRGRHCNRRNLTQIEEGNSGKDCEPSLAQYAAAKCANLHRKQSSSLKILLLIRIYVTGINLYLQFSD